MSSRLWEVQLPFTYFNRIIWLRWMRAFMWTCGDTPLSKLWPGRTSCFILHKANIQFVSTQLYISSYLWKKILFEWIQTQSSVTFDTCGTLSVLHVHYKPWQHRTIQTIRLFSLVTPASPHTSIAWISLTINIKLRDKNRTDWCKPYTFPCSYYPWVNVLGKLSDFKSHVQWKHCIILFQKISHEDDTPK